MLVRTGKVSSTSNVSVDQNKLTEKDVMVPKPIRNNDSTVSIKITLD